MLQELSKKDSYWRSIAFNICKDKYLSDDLVNDMYLKLADCQKEINDFYVIIVIKNLFLDYVKQTKTVDLEYYKEPINDLFEIDDKQKDLIDSLEWWEKELIEMTYNSSLRKVANELNINYAFVHRVIKRAKNGKKKK